MNTLPEWMRPNSTPECTAFPHKRRRNPVRRAVASFAGVLAEFLADDAAAGRKGFLQGIDARAKVIGLVGLIITATFLQSFTALLICFGFCIALVIVSRVSIRRFVGVWLTAPLLTMAVMLPATLNIVTPGKAVLTILGPSSSYSGFVHLPAGLAITSAGLVVAGRIILRTLVCISLATLLAATTRRVRLFRALRMLGVPQIFVMLLTMMERYLVVLVQAAEEIHLAKLSRSVGTAGLRQEHKWIGAGIGSLYRRTDTLGHAVYRAMLSRGYTGEVHSLDEPKWRRRDWMFLSVILLLSIILLMIG